MQRIILKILDKDNNVKLCKSSFDFVYMTYKGEYQDGDKIYIETEQKRCYLKLRLEDSFESSLVYLTEGRLSFTVPFNDERRVYSQKAFQGGIHFLWVRGARAYEINQYSNLAYNPYLQVGQIGVYPQITSNIKETNIRFAPRNVVDGYFDNSSHGSYPFTSWSSNQDPNAQLVIDFGRDVEVCSTIILLRADFPHDTWWKEITLLFSSGEFEILKLARTQMPQQYDFSPKLCSSVTLSNLVKVGDSHTALSQIEILGRSIV